MNTSNHQEILEALNTAEGNAALLCEQFYEHACAENSFGIYARQDLPDPIFSEKQKALKERYRLFPKHLELLDLRDKIADLDWMRYRRSADYETNAKCIKDIFEATNAVASYLRQYVSDAELSQYIPKELKESELYQKILRQNNADAILELTHT